MNYAKAVEAEISHITSKLVEVGLCADQNWPSVRTANHEDGQIAIVGIDAVDSLSFALKNVEYQETYEELKRRRCYNFSMVDGGLVQLMYRFQKNALISHTVGFWPSPDLLDFQNNAEVYQEDVLYSEVIERNIIVAPLRIDFDPQNFREYHHPRTHLTIGQFKNCRIPVSAPFTPYQFMNLVLRAFYNTAFNSYCATLTPKAPHFEECITAFEQSLPHLRSCV
ncbi:DUF2290 domain-containing protein [Phaeobacter inhibens]|uniref:DUF2290 domain-containing protein n=1 Tax=Phaeobacter inhibens TaxID=221822 RepID=UPI000485214F|nr:DUF2290 domain-containing protein [Phaeobacter inhibens]